MSKKLLARICFVMIFVLGTAVLIRSTVLATTPTQETPPPWLDPNNFSAPLLAQSTTQPNLSQPEQTTDAIMPWSKVAFQSYRDGNWEIYMGSDDGSGQIRLTNNGSSDIHPRLNRGATRIVFSSNRDGNYEIYSMNTSGSELTRLTGNTTDDVNPVWSPDGTKIAFQAYRDGQSEIYIMNADGSAQTRLTTDSNYDGTPAWSPDGTKIAFVSQRTGGYRIYTINTNGSGLTQISNQPYSFNPIWSPDGTKIAFDADSDGDGWQDLWVMNNEGSDQKILYDPIDQTDAWARSWSPDSQYVAFTQISFTEYQGNWYWTYAYLNAQNTQPNWFDPTQIRLSNNSLDWNPDWQTQDIIPPASNINPISPFTKIGELLVTWDGYDNLSGIEHYEVQFHSDTDLAWQNWLTTTKSYATFNNGEVGKTYYFRARAVDASKNVKTWDSAATTSTTLYTRQITGQITDNRGTPLSSVALHTSPEEVSLAASSIDGVYHMWLGSFYTNTISVINDSYAHLPSTTKWVTDDLTLNYVLPPLDNQIDNSGFEDMLNSSNWQIYGVQPPTRTEATNHTGQWAIKLGAPPPQYNFLDGNLCVRPIGDTDKPYCNFTTIQAAIDAAQPNQTIWAFPGTYTETLSITKNLSLRSIAGPHLTFIDGNAKNTVIYIQTSNVLIEGFTIQNGLSYFNGGGITIGTEGTTIIRNNRFINNSSSLRGGGIYANGDAQIIGNWFIENYASFGVASKQPACIYSYTGTPLITNNIFWNNRKENSGSCIDMYYITAARIYNNTFVSNINGIDPYSYADVRNNIVIDSLNVGLGHQTYGDVHCAPTVYYNDVWNNLYNYGTYCTDQNNQNGNISINPQLQDNFQLSINSPLRNAGDPDPVFNDPDGSRNDMGAYGGPYTIQKEIDPSPWSHAWYDLSSWSGETITVSFQLKDSFSGIVRSGLSQVVTITNAILNPTLSFLYQTGQESTPGTERFVVVIESDTGQTTEFIISDNTENQLWAFLDEVTLGSAYPDLQISINGKGNALPGEQETYTIKYKNQGGVSAGGILVTAVLPDELTFSASSITPVSTSPLMWSASDLPANSDTSAIIFTTTVAISTISFKTLTTHVDIGTTSTELQTVNNRSFHDLFIGRFAYLPIINKE